MSITGDITITVNTASIDALIARVNRLSEVVAKYADLITQEAQRLAPVKTGALRASITAHLDGVVAEVTAGEGLPDARAVYMEYGTARIAPRAYMRPAMERYADAFIAEVQAVLNGA